MNSSDLLEQIITESSNSPSALAIFDLDSTLFHVNPRTLKVLHDFAAEPTHRKRFPKATEILASVQTLMETYHVREQIHHLGLGEEEKEFHKLLYEYWRERFFSNDYLDFDEPYEGAVEFTRKLAKNGVHIMYLTGRDVGRMQKGTERSLKKWGFPLDESNVELVLKPHRGMDDAKFKAEFIRDMDRTHDPIWFFENEPINIEQMGIEVPHVRMVFFDSVHSGRFPEPGDEIPRIKNFLASSNDDRTRE